MGRRRRASRASRLAASGATGNGDAMTKPPRPRPHLVAAGSSPPDTTLASLEAERAVLGAVLIDPPSLATAARRLAPADFHLERHQLLFQTMLDLYEQATPIDLRTLQAWLEARGQFEQIGGLAFLAALDLDLPDLSRIGTYVEIVKDRALRRQLVDTADRLRRAAATEPLSDIASATQAELDRLAAAAQPTAAQATDLATFLDTPRLRREFLVEGLLRERDRLLLHGWRGLGKTWWLIWLACCLVTGRQFLRYKVPRPASCLYVDAEMDGTELADRFREVMRSLQTEPQASLRLLAFQDLPDGRPLPNLDTDEGQAAIFREIEVMDRCDVVILDNRTTLFRSDRDSNTPESWQRGQLFLQELTRRYGVACVLAHHDGKNRQQRGTSEIETVMAQCVHLTELRDGHPDAGARFKVTLTKNRAGIRGEAASPFTAHLVRDEHGRLAWSLGRGTVSDDEILELLDTGMSKAAVANELGINRSTVYRALERRRDGDG